MRKLEKYIFLFLALTLTTICTNCSYSGFSNRNTQPRVVIQTELGNIVLEIDLENAPVTAANFLKYVDEKRFNNSSFYRVVRTDNQPGRDIKIEVIQGGIGVGESPLRLPPIGHETTSETGILHEDGTISMARAEVGTASSEIFICIGDQPELDYMGKRHPDGQGFAAFGHVVKGMDVVKRIQSQAADKQMLINPVKIKKIKRRLF